MSISSNSSFEYITDDDDVGNWESELGDEGSEDSGSDIEGLEVIDSFVEVKKIISEQKEQAKKRDMPSKIRNGDILMFLSLAFLIFLMNAKATSTKAQGNIYEGLIYDESENISFDVVAWTLKMNHEAARVSHALKLHHAIQKFDGMSVDEKQRMNKWTPLPARFIGVQAYLEAIGKNGTATEEFLYRSTPRFFNIERGPIHVEVEFVMDNFKISTNTVGVNILNYHFFKGAQLEISESYGNKNIKRLYYVKSEDLLSLLD